MIGIRLTESTRKSIESISIQLDSIDLIGNRTSIVFDWLPLDLPMPQKLNVSLTKYVNFQLFSSSFWTPTIVEVSMTNFQKFLMGEGGLRESDKNFKTRLKIFFVFFNTI